MQEWIAGPWGPVLIFSLRWADVTVATIRVLLMNRRREWVPVIGFFEMVLWVFAVGGTVANFTSPLHILAFAAGYAAGNWTGIRIEERMAIGLTKVRVIVREGGEEVATFLRSGGFGVTEIPAFGKDGPVRILDLILRRKEARRCVDLIHEEVPGAFVVMEEPRKVEAGFMGRGKRL